MLQNHFNKLLAELRPLVIQGLSQTHEFCSMPLTFDCITRFQQLIINYSLLVQANAGHDLGDVNIRFNHQSESMTGVSHAFLQLELLVSAHISSSVTIQCENLFHFAFEATFHIQTDDVQHFLVHPIWDLIPKFPCSWSMCMSLRHYQIPFLSLPVIVRILFDFDSNIH